MTNKAAAIRYARALFDVALKEQADLPLIERQLADFVDLFNGHSTLKRVLLNPAVPVPRKRAAVADLTTRAGVTPVLAKLLVLLAERDRLVLLADLLASYRDKVLDHEHVVRAEVTTATPLADDRVRSLEQRLARVAGRRVTLAARVDPSIIGGIVTRIGSTVYDGSVTRQLEKIRSRLVEGI
jgi:F-type H+-transporting ATPase subunit delta